MTLCASWVRVHACSATVSFTVPAPLCSAQLHFLGATIGDAGAAEFAQALAANRTLTAVCRARRTEGKHAATILCDVFLVSCTAVLVATNHEQCGEGQIRTREAAGVLSHMAMNRGLSESLDIGNNAWCRALSITHYHISLPCFVFTP